MKVKSWLDQIPLIIQHFETQPQAAYTRREIEALFKVGRSAATRIMEIAGAEVRNGVPASVTQESLKYYVERCPEAQTFLEEVERKRKLAAKMQTAAADLRLKSIPIPAKASDQWSTFDNLPNISIKRGEIRVLFSGEPRNALLELYKMAMAALDDWDRFEQMCGEEPPDEVKRTELKAHMRFIRDMLFDLLESPELRVEAVH